MATNRKTEEERMREIDEKMKQLQEQRQTLLKRQNEKERKERTKRLIENGALSEKYFDCEKITPTEFEKLLQHIVSLEPVKNYLTQRNNTNNTTTTQSNSNIKTQYSR